jgi:hypothetical protein
VKNKRLKYRPIKQGETLDISVALSQASALLDKIVEKARVNNDSGLLLDVIDRWIKIAGLFGGEEEPEEHMDTDANGQYGFVVEHNEEVVDEDE